MLLTNKQILASSNAMAVLSQVALPVKTSFAVAKVSIGIRGALALVSAERDKLIEKHATKDGEGQRAVNPDGTIPLIDGAAFQADEADLMSIEQEITADPLSMGDLGDVSVPPAVFVDLEWLFAK